MNANDKFTVAGKTYIAEQQLGAGGQGLVWKVKNTSDGKFYALKVLGEKDLNRRANKVANIRHLIREDLETRLGNVTRSLGVDHAFPIAMYNNPSAGETGYIMEFVEGRMLSRILSDGTADRMSGEEKLDLIKKVCIAIDTLHSSGYCYTDISLGNFMWEEKSRVLHVIDCENVACTADINSGRCAFLKGTGFFIAPEVAFDNAPVSPKTDRYALATLIFCFLTGNGIPSAYHGVAMYSAVPACMDMIDVADMDDKGDIDKNWRRFVFDKTDRSNGLDNLAKNSKNPRNKLFRSEVEKVISLWKKMDDRLKTLFYQAFADPFDKNARPLPSTWVRTINDILGIASSSPSSPRAAAKPAPAAAKPAPAAVSPAPAAVSPAHAAAKPVPAHAAAPEAFIPAAGIHPTDIKYGAFVPAGAKPAAVAQSAAVPDYPCLISSKNNIVAISGGQISVEGAPLGLAQKQLGVICEEGAAYRFISSLQAAVEVCGADGAIKCTLYKGQSALLSSGDSIRPVISSVSVKIVY